MLIEVWFRVRRTASDVEHSLGRRAVSEIGGKSRCRLGKHPVRKPEKSFSGFEKTSCSNVHQQLANPQGGSKMSTGMGSREFRDQIVGKRISGVIARPGRAGQPPEVLMLRFDDGSVVEFVSPRSDRVLRSSLQASCADEQALSVFEGAQLELMRPSHAA
jgi:hypothetical protein